MPSQAMRLITKRQKTLGQVHELYFIKKWNKNAIAQVLDVTPPTVELWIRFINKRRVAIAAGKEFDVIGVSNWTMEVRDYYFECMKQAWNEFAKSKNTKERLACLDRARISFKEYFEIMQSMGIAPKAREDGALPEGQVIYKSLLRSGNMEVIEIKAEPPKQEGGPVEVTAQSL